MARYHEAKCRLCRREGERLFLRGARCHTAKCAIARRAYAPGVHALKRRKRLSDYGLELREKQKLKRVYGILERQFRRYFEMADRQTGDTGANLLTIIERRLDNVVFLGGFADSRAQARLLIGHGHVRVNGRRVDVASVLVRKGDVIAPMDKERSKKFVRERLEVTRGEGIPQWLSVDPKAMEIRVNALPAREDVTTPIQVNLIVELLSK